MYIKINLLIGIVLLSILYFRIEAQEIGDKSYNSCQPAYKNSRFSIDQRVTDLLSQMTLEEKIGQLNIPPVNHSDEFIKGKLVYGMGPGGGLFNHSYNIHEGARQQAKMINQCQKTAIEETRLGIPLLVIAEGTHGAMFPGATIYPEGPGIGSTWNLNLIEKIYSEVAREARVVGSHVINTIVIEPILDPRLGRNQEAYSECPNLSARIAKAIVKGAQGDDLTAPDKAIVSFGHFPGQSLPMSGLERGAMNISERTLREVYLPPWEAGLTEGGALSVMGTFPSIFGIPAHGSKEIMTKILREDLGFKGIVLCEGDGIGTLVYEKIVPGMKEAGVQSINAGIDVGIWFEEGFMGLLKESVEEGLVSLPTLDQAVRRVLELKFKLGLFENPYVDEQYAEQVMHSAEHQNTTLQAARESMVLLKNESNLLPLNKSISSIAVIGPNADNGMNQLGDYFAKPVQQEVVTVLEGIKRKVGKNTKITYVKGCNVIGDKVDEMQEAEEAARNSEVAVVVVGENERNSEKQHGNPTNGEGFDVASLNLTGKQRELVKKVAATGTPTIVVLINGRPLSTPWIAENIPAILEAWLPGEKGGKAVAEVLFGDYNPDGRLPVTIPRHVGQLPCYYFHGPSKELRIKGKNWYREGMVEGGYVDMPVTPLFHFGHGLSYTTFEYSELKVQPHNSSLGDTINISVDVKNTGGHRGGEVVQLYLNDVISSVSTSAIKLQGFKKIWLNPGEKETITFTFSPKQLTLLNQNMEWEVEPGIFEVMVGHSSDDIRLEDKFEVR